MLDIKVIRNNSEMVKAAMKNRQMNLDNEIDKILKIDEERRNILKDTEDYKEYFSYLDKEKYTGVIYE